MHKFSRSLHKNAETVNGEVAPRAAGDLGGPA